MEKYSVLMSLYIKEDATCFQNAIYSIIYQTIPPDEIVLVEDGPLTKELYSVIDSVENKFPGLITLVKNEVNKGLGASLQLGLLKTRNELVARMDTDDIAVPDRFENQLKYMCNNPDISIVGGQIEEFIDDVTKVIGKREVPLVDKEIKKYLKKRCPFNHMTVMFRKNDILEVGNYQDWYWNEDYYLWIRMAIANKSFANLPLTLVKVRTGNGMYNRRGGRKYFQSERKIQELMLKNHLISFPRFCINLIERFIIQILLPNCLRGVVFRFFART